MGWEKHRGRLYYYRKVKRAGRATSEYLGTGLMGELAAAAAIVEREKRLARMRALRELREPDEVDLAVKRQCAEADLLARAALLAAGYRRHKKGEWRFVMKRMSENTVAADVGPKIDPPRTQADVREMVTRAQETKDPAAVGALRTLFDPKGELAAKMFQGDLPGVAQEILLGKIAEKKPDFHQAVQEKLKAMRADLMGPAPSPLESLLVERVITCWLQVQHLDLFCAAGAESTHADTREMHRRQSAAHKRLLSAVRTLAVVRKLAVPVLQLNVAEQQVNVSR